MGQEGIGNEVVQDGVKIKQKYAARESAQSQR